VRRGHEEAGVKLDPFKLNVLIVKGRESLATGIKQGNKLTGATPIAPSKSIQPPNVTAQHKNNFKTQPIFGSRIPAVGISSPRSDRLHHPETSAAAQHEPFPRLSLTGHLLIIPWSLDNQLMGPISNQLLTQT
jgi:hypothetical protein